MTIKDAKELLTKKLVEEPDVKLISKLAAEIICMGGQFYPLFALRILLEEEDDRTRIKT